MAAFWEQPVPDRIIGVGWSNSFAVLQFRAQTRNASASQVNGVLVNLSQIGESYITFGFTNTAKVKSAATAYHNESSHDTPPVTTTTTTYDYVVTFNHPPDSGTGGGVITVTSDGTNSFWSSDGGAAGSGDISDAEAYYLANGWDTFSATETGSTNHTDPGHTVYDDDDNGVLIFNVNGLKSQINDPQATELILTFETGDPPPDIYGTGDVTYAWTSIISTFKPASFTSFPVDGQCLPIQWPLSIASRTDVGTANETVTYRINFNTLAIIRG